jgi:putative ABC transport system ATP-binding protein
MIRCTAVHKTYRQGGRVVEALRGVDLSIEGPGFFGIMGASGSGKSTLLHLLAALDAPDSGEIEVSGKRISGLNDRNLTLFRQREIGIVFQQFNLIPTMTARENVELPGELAGEPESWRRRRSETLLAALGMLDRAEHRPEAMSGGEQQRVAIARALLFAPRVLFADEPTGALDSVASEMMWSTLGAIAREHEMTVLMVTHEPAAAAHCKRVSVLRDGVVVGEIESEQLDAVCLADRYQQLVR